MFLDLVEAATIQDSTCGKCRLRSGPGSHSPSRGTAEKPPKVATFRSLKKPCATLQPEIREKSRQFSPQQIKKADVDEHPEVFDHVGLLVNEPPGQAGLPFI